MSAPPLVSLVIPCFNAEAWIGDTIASVLAQRGTSLEIVLVDDGSTDRSLAIAQEAGGAAIQIIRQARQGVSRARNVGTEVARGEFIQYLDADDLLVADTLRLKVEALRSSEADVAYGDWVYWEARRPEGRQLQDGAPVVFGEGQIVRRTIGDRPDIDIFGGKWWPLAALLYRRTLVEKMLPWREDLPIIQDARFLLDAALCGGRFVHVEAVTARYRVLPESLSRRDPRTFFEDCYRNGAELHRRWEANGTFDAERRRCVIGLYGFLARSFFPIDRRRFHDMVRELQQLEPNFVPDQPPTLRALATLVGYPTAEHLAGWWRMARTAARRTRPRIDPETAVAGR